MADVPQYKHEKEIVCITGGEDMLYTSSGKRTITAWNTIDNSKREFKVTRYHKINAKLIRDMNRQLIIYCFMKTLCTLLLLTRLYMYGIPR